MLDGRNRSIDYMRVSITDRCDLRCVYCMPEDLPSIPHDEILTYEEILRVCGIAARLGIRTVKVTGGEPLVRKGCVSFLRELKAVDGIENVTLTTNGKFLHNYAQKLAEIGLGGVNISLDTLDRDTYCAMTGTDGLEYVLRSIEEALRYGLRVKINCVPIRGINDGDLLLLVSLAEKYPVDVRFIELMPKGAGAAYEGIDGGEILSELSKIYPLAADDRKRGYGPAKYYTCGRFKGSIGFISTLSGHFCDCCNRIRLTSDGFLKLCLYHEDELDLRELLRSGAGDGQIEAAIAGAIRAKPEGHRFESGAQSGVYGMSRIGG